MNMAENTQEAPVLERFIWEGKKAFSSFKDKPVFILLLIQIPAYLFVRSKGAGKLYADMLLILVLIILAGWFFTSMIHGNRKVLICALLLLTVGTMLQCIMKQEQMIKNPELYENNNPVTNLQIQYVVAFGAGLAAAALYRKRKAIASMRVCRILVLLSCLISVVTLLFSHSVGHTRNWLVLGGASLQTTEIVKVLYVFICAGLLGTTENPSKQRVRVFYAITAVQILFFALQSEFGTMLLILTLFLLFTFLFLPKIKTFLKTLAALGAAAALFVLAGTQLGRLAEAGPFLGTNALSRFFLTNYDKIAGRFLSWLHPGQDVLGLGYQITKAQESIVMGGWFGTSSVTELPVKTSDLVFPALIQRCGMVFALVILCVFVLFWLEGIRLFIRKKDGYHRALGAGFVCMIFYQAMIIIGGSTGLLPLTGITLPFISSGGSSLVMTFVMTAMILAVSGDVKWKGIQTDEEEFFKKNPHFARGYVSLRYPHVSRTLSILRPGAGRLRGGGSTEADG